MVQRLGLCTSTARSGVRSLIRGLDPTAPPPQKSFFSTSTVFFFKDFSLCGPFFKKSLLNLMQYCFCFFFFLSERDVWSELWTRDGTRTPGSGSQSPNHQTTGEVPLLVVSLKTFFFNLSFTDINFQYLFLEHFHHILLFMNPSLHFVNNTRGVPII